MSRPIFAFVLAFGALIAGFAPVKAAETRPNVLIIVADDLGYADLGFQGCKDIPTPNLDALAKSGVRCTSGYVTGPYCSPTRAGLLTGRYQQRFGHEFNPGGAGPNVGLPLSQTTLADQFKAAGYTTGLVGKWHLGNQPKFHPQKRGFDEFFGFLGGAHGYFPAEAAAPILQGTKTVKETEYLTDAFTREAVSFIERHKADPFVLYLAYNAVHTPMHATDARLTRFASITDKRRQTYAAMLFAMDEGVGKVLNALDSTGVRDNTLIVFFSDNGGPTMPGTTINGSSNAPLRGSKRTTCEGGIRVPFVFSWKGKLPAGATYESPIAQIDVLPTALAACGATPKPDTKFDGVNLLPYLKGENKDVPHTTLFWRLGGQNAVRHGEWKLVQYDAALDTPGEISRGVPKISPPRLYNLAADIGETKDVSAENPLKVALLQSLLQEWNKGNVKPLWGQGGQE